MSPSDEYSGTTGCEELLPWVNGSAAQLFSVSDSCPNIFVGSRSEGEICVLSAECGAGLNCGGDTCPGTCQAGDLYDCEIGECEAGKVCTSAGCIWSPNWTSLARSANGRTAAFLATSVTPHQTAALANHRLTQD